MKIWNDFFRIVLRGNRLDQVEKYLAAGYTQHNPLVATGRKGFVDFSRSGLHGRSHASKLRLIGVAGTRRKSENPAARMTLPGTRSSFAGSTPAHVG